MATSSPTKDSVKHIACVVCLVVLLACLLIQGQLDPQSPASAIVGVTGIIAGSLVLAIEASQIGLHMNRVFSRHPLKDGTDGSPLAGDTDGGPSGDTDGGSSGDTDGGSSGGNEDDGGPACGSLPTDPASPQSAQLVASPQQNKQLQIVALEDEHIPESRRAEKLYEAFLWSLFTARKPESVLRSVVKDIRARETKTNNDLGSQVIRPSGIELYMARLLEDAGLFADDIELPDIDVGRSSSSGLVYVHSKKRKISYLAHLRIMEIESALRRVGFAIAILDNPDNASEQDCVIANHRLDSSLCAQVLSTFVDSSSSAQDHPETGEFHLRESFVRTMNSLSLPYRHNARFRAHAKEGLAAIQYDLIPASIFPKFSYSQAAERVVASTKEMRELAASDYALRLGLIFVALAFESGPELNEVYVSGTLSSSSKHSCHLWARFDRKFFSTIDLAEDFSPIEIWKAAGAPLDERNGILYPIEQGFSLEDERFCPTYRYDSLTNCERLLDSESAKRLGTHEVSGLSIDESEERELIADEIARRMSNSTESNVKVLMEFSHNNTNPTVWAAAQRTINRLIDGTLDGSNVFEFTHEFVSGDEVSKVVRDASLLLRERQPNYHKIVQLLESVIEPIWASGAYLDNQTVSWRCFSNYAERTLYNRSSQNAGHVSLLPDSHYNALLILSSCYLMAGKPERARQWAHEAARFAPFDVRPGLILVRCDEEEHNYQAAAERLVDLLQRAYEPETIAHIYYRLAFMEYKLDNTHLSDACYRKCINFNKSSMIIAMAERHELLDDDEILDPYMTSLEIDRYLEEHNIPIAPIPEIRSSIEESMRGAVDSELFGAARSLSLLFGQLTGDDVFLGIANSIEREPDR